MASTSFQADATKPSEFMMFVRRMQRLSVSKAIETSSHAWPSDETRILSSPAQWIGVSNIGTSMKWDISKRCSVTRFVYSIVLMMLVGC